MMGSLRHIIPVHRSSVHGSSSSHFDTQVPSTHRSGVHPSPPRLHGPLTGSLRQPSRGWQESAVQTLPSSQASVPLPTQDPPLHESPVVHSSPSSQGSPSGSRVQLRLSVVLVDPLQLPDMHTGWTTDRCSSPEVEHASMSFSHADQPPRVGSPQGTSSVLRMHGRESVDVDDSQVPLTQL